MALFVLGWLWMVRREQNETKGKGDLRFVAMVQQVDAMMMMMEVEVVLNSFVLIQYWNPSDNFVFVQTAEGHHRQSSDMSGGGGGMNSRLSALPSEGRPVRPGGRGLGRGKVSAFSTLRPTSSNSSVITSSTSSSSSSSNNTTQQSSKRPGRRLSGGDLQVRILVGCLVVPEEGKGQLTWIIKASSNVTSAVAVDPKIVFQLELERRKEKEKAMTEELNQLKQEVGNDDPRVSLMETELAQYRAREEQLAQELASLRSQLAQSQQSQDDANNEV